VASLVEVARLAGVSRQTVSNVLNAPDRVATATRARVEAAIAELGYRPNRSAQNLRSRRSRLLGMDLAPTGPDEVSPVLDRFTHALTEEAARVGYHVLIFPRTDDPTTSHLPLHDTRTVDGFVLVDTAADDGRAELLSKHNVPFVAFGGTGGRIPHDVIDVDGAAGTRMAVESLLASGVHRPAYLGWPDTSLAGNARRAGFEEACRAGGLDVASLPMLRRLNRVEDGVEAAMTLFAGVDRDDVDRPDAIVAASDLLAVGVIRGLRSLGLTAGRDVRVVGFDDAPIAAHLDPPLTTVRQPLEEVARRVLSRFLARLEEPDAPVTSELLDPHLVVRLT
jgi:DNA-binding LacI/PurR family transcriptional regulator